MTTTSATAAAVRANGREAFDALRAGAQRFTERNLPKAANAAESAGQALSDLAILGSKSLARTLREHKGRRLARQRGLLASPLLRSASRFARRNPALLAGAGVAVALIGYAGWRRSQRSVAEVEAESEIA